jgi:sec-independent protein translocase protein TatA
MLFAFIRNIGGPELLIILVVVLLFFGASRLPSLARSLGASAKEFKEGLEDGDESEESDEAAEESDVS